jgi:hypothetical protein
MLRSNDAPKNPNTELKVDENGIKRILVDGKKPIWEKDGKTFRSYAEALRFPVEENEILETGYQYLEIEKCPENCMRRVRIEYPDAVDFKYGVAFRKIAVEFVEILHEDGLCGIMIFPGDGTWFVPIAAWQAYDFGRRGGELAKDWATKSPVNPAEEA